MEGYVRCMTDDDVMLSARGITPSSATNLYRLAVRMRGGANHRFLYPFNIDERLATRQTENQFTLANEIARALRTHIRLLCRIIIGAGRRPDTTLMDALVQRCGLDQSRTLSRVELACLRQTSEVRHFFESQDRPIAADMAAALSALGGSDATRLLDAVLETDEQWYLHSCWDTVQSNIQESIKHRLSEMTPVEAAPIRSLG